MRSPFGIGIVAPLKPPCPGLERDVGSPGQLTGSGKKGWSESCIYAAADLDWIRRRAHTWLIRGIRARMLSSSAAWRISVSTRSRSRSVTILVVRYAAVRMFRARLLRELAPPGFFATADYDLLYRARDIRDAIYIVFPVNEDAESYFGWYRIGEKTSPFTPSDRDLLAYALRPLKWFHRRVMPA